MDVTAAAEQASLMTTLVWTSATQFLPRLVAAVLILVAGYFVARITSQQVRRIIVKSSRLDDMLAPVVSAVVRYGILIIVGVVALAQIGVQTTSILAVLGAAGLAIGLALQGTLSNIAAGFMLLWLRPFRAGDYIDAGVAAGTVKEVGLFSTEVDTYDGIYRFVPNSQLWNTPIFNYTRNPTRLTNLAIGIDYTADIPKAKQLLLELARSDSRVKPFPEPDVFVDDLGDSSVVLRYRVWIGTSDFWATQRALLEEAKRRLEANGIGIPFPQRVIHMAKDSAPPPPAEAA